MPLPKKLPTPSSAASNLPPPSRDPQKEGSGRILANRYELSDKLGSGAFGSAFLVRDLRAGRERWVDHVQQAPCTEILAIILYEVPARRTLDTHVKVLVDWYI